MAKPRAFGPPEGRVILALHCSLAHGGAWDPLWRQLPELRMIAPDLPGHGTAPLWDGVSDLHDLATSQAISIAETYGPLDLIGHSFGGTVALRLALERPELIRSLVLVEPVLFAAARDSAIYPAFEADHRQFEAMYQAGDAAEATRHFLNVWGDGRPFDQLPPHLRSYMIERIVTVIAQDEPLSSDSLGILAPGRLEGLHCPVLLVEGANSPAVVGAIHDVLAARLPQASRLRIEGASHMLTISHPKALAEAVRAHLARAMVAGGQGAA